VELFPEQTGPGRCMGVMALLAWCGFHRVSLMGRSESDVDLVAPGTAFSGRKG
jgi:hypothetical protein